VVLAVTEEDKSEDEPVARFAKAISSSQGVLTLITVLPGKFEDLIEERHARREAWHERAKEDMLPYFREVVIGTDTGSALRALQLSYGMGQLRPNTLLLGWSDTINAEYERILTDSARLRRNVILMHVAVRSAFHTDAFEDIPAKRRRIDVWWRGHQNGSLALLLAHLVRENASWRGCTIRLLRIEQDEEKTDAAKQELVDLIDASRIAAEVKIVTDPRAPFEVIAELSGESHLVFMGVGMVGEGGAVSADLARYKPVLESLPTTALVFSSQNLDVEV
jgi:solute carrier family 12 protein